MTIPLLQRLPEAETAAVPSDDETSSWSAFRTALLKPSWHALLLTLAVAAACWGYVVFGLTRERMADWAPYFAASIGDTCTFVTGRVFRMEREVDPDAPGVVLLGASGMRDTITSTEALAEELGLDDGDGPRVWSLVSDGQNALETAALVGELPDDFAGVLVIGVNPLRLSPGAARVLGDRFEYRLGFHNRVVFEASRRAGLAHEPAPSLFLENTDFWLPRLRYLYKHLRRGKPEQRDRPPNREQGGRVGQEAWDWFASLTKGMHGQWRERASRGLDVMVRAIEAHPNRERIEVVWLDEPASERAREEYFGERFYADYRTFMEQFASQRGFRFWSLVEEAELTEADFFDWGHLNHAAPRARYTSALAGRLGPLLEELERR